MMLSCVGNALYDVIGFVETDFSSSIGIHNGTTAHQEHSRVDKVVKMLSNKVQVAGGGAANTARIFSALGQKSAFAGVIGKDNIASLYEKDLKSSGVDCFLQHKDGDTGLFCAMIAPDGRRTVIVNSGVASSLDVSSIDNNFFSSDSILYVDGFLATNCPNFNLLVQKAKDCGMKIALDVGSERVAKKNKDYLLDFIANDCSYTFMNEDEFLALTSISVEESLPLFSSNIKGIAIVKRAETGAVCVCDGQVLESAVRPIFTTDTTGAGDAFAAGFLYASMRNCPLALCLRIGNRVAEQVIQIPGMNIDTEELQRSVSFLF